MSSERPPNDTAAVLLERQPKRPRILVVEDDFLVRVLLAEMLDDDGFDVVQADTGDTALHLCDDSIALLITDLRLPGLLDGQQLVTRIRRARPDLPVIYTSGQAQEMGTLDGRAEAVSKPYQARTIQAAIHRLLGWAAG